MEIYGQIESKTDLLIGTMQYQHFNWTQKMLDSISSENWNIQIVLLDQGSLKKEFQKTLKYHQQNPHLIILRSDCNLGIPKGWNTLVKYGLQFVPNVIVAPNDIIYRMDTIDTLLEAWAKKPFDNVITVSSIWMGKKRGHSFEEFQKTEKFKIAHSWTFTGFNGLINEEFIEKVGLWDEKLGPWWWNDTDLLLRIFKSGFLGMAVQNSRVWFTERSTKRETFSKKELSEVYGKNKKYFYEKHKLDINSMEQKTWQFHYWITDGGRVMIKNKLRLNIGRGGHSNGEWANVDIDPSLEPDIIDDIRTLKKISDQSCLEIFASHILEHIDEKEVLPTLKLWNFKLRSGGKLTIYVPDVEKAWDYYFKDKISEKDLLIAMIGQDPGRSQYQLHRTMFWYNRLARLLEEAGFLNVTRIPHRQKRPFEFGVQAGK